MPRHPATIVALAVISAAAARGQDAPAKPFGEGWEKVVAVTNPLLGDGDRYVAWVERGWLQARRQTKAGAVDWHVVLAKVEGPGPPTVSGGPGGARFEVSYRDGRYFAREDLNVLRCVRQRKPEGDGAWPALRPPDGEGGNAGGPGCVVRAWRGPGGFVVLSGPSPERSDARVRLSSKDSKGGHGFEVVHDSTLVRAWFRDFWALDDGELLVATRGLESVESRELEVGDPAPDFAAKLLKGGEVRLADYRGKFVLLDFWATWCAPCVAEFPGLARLHEAHGGGRLAILGLSTDDEPDAPAKFVEARKLPWAQAHVGGEGETVAVKYGVTAIPATFLIGPDGRIVAKDLRGEDLAKAIDKALRTDAAKK